MLALDRFTKRLVAKDIPLHGSITVIKRVFYITHVENRGAAFGLFNDSPSPMEDCAAGFVLGSCAGDCFGAAVAEQSHHDRVGGWAVADSGRRAGEFVGPGIHGRVVDFLLVYIGSYQWPAFNVADSAIVVGAGLLVFEILFAKAPEQKVGVRFRSESKDPLPDSVSAVRAGKFFAASRHVVRSLQLA